MAASDRVPNTYLVVSFVAWITKPHLKAEAKRKNQIFSRDADNLSRELFSIVVMNSPTRTPWSSLQPWSLGTLPSDSSLQPWSLGTLFHRTALSSTTLLHGRCWMALRPTSILVSNLYYNRRARILVGLHLDWSLVVLPKGQQFAKWKQYTQVQQQNWTFKLSIFSLASSCTLKNLGRRR
jgi:hypothetical protein